ncbi:MAG: aminoacyl-tRNA hydrolase [Gammaproteobacteria bacterium]|nr:MAG: aminoacyl-tRNA hydrolase [Gammaproteobacteria bacterium]
MQDAPSLIVGLGNPGAEHARDRHNIGYWFVDDLASGLGARFSAQQKLLGQACLATLRQLPVRLLKPTTFMNRSGQSVRQTMDYYKVPAERVLVIHDDLDLPAGTARLKRGGGHGGHNGLRDIIAHCGREFMRLRLGIGHPGRREQVVGFVLHPPGKDELLKLEDAIHAGRRALEVLCDEGLGAAMKNLHTVTPPNDVTNDSGPAG